MLPADQLVRRIGGYIAQPIGTDLNPPLANGPWGQKAVVPLDRYGHLDEVAALVALVAGPESPYINGANLIVDGAPTPDRNAGGRDSHGHAD